MPGTGSHWPTGEQGCLCPERRKSNEAQEKLVSAAMKFLPDNLDWRVCPLESRHTESTSRKWPDREPSVLCRASHLPSLHDAAIGVLTF